MDFANGSDTLKNTVALCPICHRKMQLLNLKSDQDIIQKATSKLLIYKQKQERIMKLTLLSYYR